MNAEVVKPTMERLYGHSKVFHFANQPVLYCITILYKVDRYHAVFFHFLPLKFFKKKFIIILS
jgi:hypothetical protein